MESANPSVASEQVSQDANAVTNTGNSESDSKEASLEQGLANQLAGDLQKQLDAQIGETDEGDEAEEVETAAEETEDDGTEKSAEEVALEAQPSKKRAEERVQKLANEKNELKQTITEMNQQYQQQMMQMEQARRNDQAQLAQALQQLAQLETGRLSAERRKAQQAYMERMQQEDPRGYFEQQMLEKAKQQLMPEVQKMQQQLKQQEQQRQQALQKAQFQMQVRKVTQQAEQEVEKNFFGNLPHVKRGGYAPMLKPLADIALSYGAAYGVTPDQAAAKVMELVKSYQRLASPPMQAKTDQAKKLGQVAAAAPSKVAVQGDKVKAAMPDFAAVKKAGYSNYLQWIDAGRPPV